MSALYNTLLIESEPANEHDRLRRGLMRLFPRLQSIWENMHYTDTGTWSRNRRVCAEEHFETYFRYSLSPQTVSRDEITNIIRNAADQNLVENQFRAALNTRQGNGRTKASYILDELRVHAEKFADDHVPPFLTALFRIADDLDNPADESRGFGTTSNTLRIHWLLRQLTMERFDIDRRSTLFRNACETASLAWLIEFSDSAYAGYHPREGREPEPAENCLTTSDDADALRELGLARIRRAAEDGTLKDASSLAYILFRWRDLAADDGAEVRAWTSAAIEQQDMLPILARSFLGTSWSQGMGFGGLGDLVARRNDRAQIDTIDTILDAVQFRERLRTFVDEDGASEEQKSIVTRLLSAWDQRERGVD